VPLALRVERHPEEEEATMHKAVALALSLVLLPGCGIFVEPYVNIEPKVNLAKKKTLLVVPFSDAEHASFASADGVELAELIIREVQAGAPKARLVELEDLRRLYGEQDLEAVGCTTVGQALGADYVLVGRIESFTVRDPRAPNFLLGHLTLDLKVVSVADGSTFFRPPRSETVFRWSETGDPEIGTPDFDTTPEKIRQGTLELAARRISDYFCRRQINRTEWERRQHRSGQMLSQ
jgi:hypothetical protein